MITNKDELLAAINIVDIVEHYIPLKKNGANYKACCPFHPEDTPSFVVNPVKNIFKCFGCGKGGDAVEFVREHKKLDFKETLEEIASIANFSLTYDKSYTKKNYKNTIESVNTFYMQNIDKAKEYLTSRAVSEESIKNFELGYAPNSKEQMDYFNTSLLPKDDLVEIGIVNIKDKKSYARISSRLTFPMRNHTGKLCGFSGRILPNDKRVAKYLNSPQTKLYDKSSLLYGYYQAKDNIYKKRVITIVEGHLDAVLLHQAGFNTSVALCGTALTPQHINTLIKKTDAKVMLCLDGDKAGREASFKAAKLLSLNEIDGGVVSLEENTDPSDMIANGQIKELLIKFKNATPLIKYILLYIKSKYNIDNPHQKNRAFKEANSFLNSINPIIADEYRDFLSQTLCIDKKHIKSKTKPQKNPPKSNYNIAELNLIATALIDKKYIVVLKEQIQPNMFTVHQKELISLFENSNSLEWIWGLEQTTIYDKTTFLKAIEFIKQEHKSRQMQSILKSDIATKEKLKLINEL